MNRDVMTPIKKRIWLTGLFIALLGVIPSAAASFSSGEGGAAGLRSSIGADSVHAQGIWITLPLYHLGFEVITEGTNDYPMNRQLRNVFPLDMDITVMGVYGYDGDKLILTIEDQGDTGDRLAAVAYVQYAYETIPFWGTLYSSDSQDSFEISIPVSEPGVIVYLFSWYFAPSTGEDPYTYTITASFPQ